MVASGLISGRRRPKRCAQARASNERRRNKGFLAFPYCFFAGVRDERAETGLGYAAMQRSADLLHGPVEIRLRGRTGRLFVCAFFDGLIDVKYKRRRCFFFLFSLFGLADDLEKIVHLKRW